MRVSDLLGQRFWATGLAVVVAMGSCGIAAGQVQSGAFQAPQSNETLGKIESWLADARQAIADGNQQAAENYLQVADSIARQPGANLPADFSLDDIRAEIASMGSAPPTPPVPPTNTGGNDFVPLDHSSVSVDNLETLAQNSLLKARQELAMGNSVQATAMMNKAKECQVDFAKLGDSPDNIQNLITRQNELVQMARVGDRDVYNNQAAEFLLTQANALIAYEDSVSAEKLIAAAKVFPVDFAQLGFDPDAMLVQARADAKQSTSGTSFTLSDNSMQESARDSVMRLMSQAQLAVDQENWAVANDLVQKAKALNVPDAEFAPGMMRPWQMELVVNDHLKRIKQADVIATEDSMEANDRHVITAGLDSRDDDSQIIQVAALEEPFSKDERRSFSPVPGRGMDLYRSGVEALGNNDRARAKEYFQTALQYREQLDSETRSEIRAHLASYQESGFATQPAPAEMGMDDQQQKLFRRLQTEVFSERDSAERLLKTSPRKALEKMTYVRNRINESDLDAARKRPLLTIIDRDMNQMQSYIDEHLSEILLEETNRSNLERVESRRQIQYDTELQIQKLVEEFNDLKDQRRWPEAAAIARQAQDLDPDNAIVVQLMENARFLIRQGEIEELEAIQEASFQRNLGPNSITASTVIDTDQPYQFGRDHDDWIRRSQIRKERLGLGQYSSEAERDIWNILKNTKVSGEYTGTLTEAIDQLSTQANINIVFDMVALTAEGVTTNAAVEVPIRNAITLQSALNLVLASHGLVFVVQDEVIKVTSTDAQRKDRKAKTYYVGDLVTPVRSPQNPMQMNFVTPYQNLNTQNSVLANNMPVTAPNQMNAQAGGMNAVAMAQQLPGSGFGGQGYGSGGNPYDGGPSRGAPIYTSLGAPQMGGVSEADFTNLIDLIKSTIAVDDWDDTNGDGTIQAFVPNLSLIVSQTQEVQDQIQDLLTRLRELNDVQIVVEVRFVTLSDNFFERIGIDFDFRLNDNSGLDPNALPDEVGQSVVIGREPISDAFLPTADLDVGFNQNSFGSAVPTFGGFDAATAANFGFAILSDIEVFFLIQASKGDQRSNITQAPTVTMFNGQSGSVSDGSNRPFVTSVVPVVGDFAVAHQPVISLLPDGTSLNVQATASHDRRFVRLSLVPFFSQITDVETFTFDGSTTTRTATDSLLEDLLNQGGINIGDDDEGIETINQGTTVQLPVVAFTTINTVVSVPDGGTVLMGGVKRMREGRTERGVPFLSNVPYVNRLFKNVGIGRETQNLMMMVTPRIIISEEEERFQVGPIGGN